MPSKKQLPSNDKANSKRHLPKPSITTPNIMPQQIQAPTLQRARLAPHLLTPPEVQHLQRTIGNQAVGQLLEGTAHHPLTRKKKNNTGWPDHLETGGKNLKREAVQRVLSLDGEHIAGYNKIDQTKQSLIIEKCKGTIDISPEEVIERIIGELIDHEDQFVLTTEELIGLIPQVYKLYFENPTSLEESGNDPASKIAKRMQENDEESGKLGKKLTSKGQIEGRNARALNQFLETHPKFETFINDKGLRLIFESRVAKGIGGMYGEGVVHLESKVGKESGEVFMRTLLHEMGHGTFQQLLLKEKLGESSSKGKLGELQNRHLQIVTELRTLMSDTTQVGRRKNIGGLQGQATRLGELVSEREEIEQELRTEAEKFTEDGKTFYDAWQILRQNDGEYLLGLDLGSVMKAEGRKVYQANTFEEFCAESFMHMAKEGPALVQHIRNIVANPDVPGEVKTAWQAVARILSKYKHIIMED